MEPEPVLREIAEAFIRFVHDNPDMPVSLHVRVGDAMIELRYRAAELAGSKAVGFGIRHAPPARARPGAATLAR